MENQKVKVSFTHLGTNFINLPTGMAQFLESSDVLPQNTLVEIVTQSKQKIYLGWSGSSTSTPGTIEVDSQAAGALNLREKQAVTVSIKFKYVTTKEVTLEPKNASDYELVDLHSHQIEDTLVNQTRCVAVGQPVILFPSKTTHVTLIATDIGTKESGFAKLDPYAEIVVVPKIREKKSNSVSGKSLQSAKSTNAYAESYTGVPMVLKRAISLPHDIFAQLPPDHTNADGYEVYVNYNDVINILGHTKFVAVSIIPGPAHKTNTIADSQQQQQQQQDGQKDPSSTKEKVTVPLKENKRIVAKLVSYHACPPNTVGLSYKLAVALNAEHKVGASVVLKPAVKNLQKRPSTLIVHPYITQTKKTSQINLNSTARKNEEARITAQLATYLYNDQSPMSASPVTNFLKLPKIPHILPCGGLLRFKRNDDLNAWIRPYDIESKKPPKFQLGEDLLRNASFLEEQDIPSTTTTDKPVGLEDTISEIVQTISTFPNSGTLIHGNSGSGKTLLLRTIGNEINSKYGIHTKFVSCESIMNENFNSLAANHVTKWFQECTWHKPSLLILDNLDKLLSAEVEHVDSSSSKQLTEYFISQLSKIHNQANSSLSVLASGVSKESFNGFLFQSHVIESFHQLSVPDKITRSKILQDYIENTLGCFLDFDVMDMVSETEGFLPNDLKTLCDRMYHESFFSSAVKSNSRESPRPVSRKIFEKAFEGYTPSNLRGVKLQKSSISWTDIGGLTEAKNIMLETLEWPTKYAPIFANCPLRLRSGILLYGYPGCGKTLLASAVAGQCGLNFISIKGPEILNKYIGASEQSVRELFERAQSAKPCILFFDEFDSIAPKRGHDSTGVTDRVVNQMLTQMDGAEGLDGVYVLAATSRPDLIDSALLRPGRLDKSVICDMPNYEDRLDILKSITNKMDLEDDVNLDRIANKTAGFSGADMQGLGYNAYLKAVHVKLANDEARALNGKDKVTGKKKAYEFFQVLANNSKNNKLKSADKVKLIQQIEQVFSEESVQNESKTDADTKESSDSSDSSSKVRISQADFEASLEETKPSISVTEKQKLDKIYRQFVSGRDGNMPDGSASNDIGGRTTLM